jgi:hypothetical protein
MLEKAKTPSPAFVEIYTVMSCDDLAYIFLLCSLCYIYISGCVH